MGQLEQCEAKIRPLPNPTELRCEKPAGHDGDGHTAVLADYAYPGSRTRIEWMEGDRRTFRGEWEPCPEVCSLPAGHRGLHVS